MKHLFRSLILSQSLTIGSGYEQSMNTFAGLGHQHTLSWLVFSRFIRLRLWLATRSKYQWLAGSTLVIAVPAAILAVQFILPRSATFSYASETCFYNPTLFPQKVTTHESSHFSVQAPARATLGRTAIFSTQTCIYAKSIPGTNESETLQLRNGLFAKNIHIYAPALPQPVQMTKEDDPITQKDGLRFKTDSADAIFSYKLIVNSEQTICPMQDHDIYCPLATMDLSQGKSYDYTLERTLDAHAKPALSGKFLLRDPVFVSESSISDNQTILDKPDAITLTTNKALKDVKGARLTFDESELEIEAAVSESTVQVGFKEQLPRGKTFTLHIETLEASDGAYLETPYTLTFTTSEGPKVAGVNISSYKVAVDGFLQLTFDTPLGETASSYVSLTTGATTVASTSKSAENKITIVPKNNLNPCTTYTLIVKDDIPNQYGVSGNSSWTTSFRTICQQTFSIGTSVNGRTITAYKFGSGTSSRVLFVGGLHGNETSSVYTLNSWVDELERNYAQIPTTTTVVVIPNMNPDGFIGKSRTNAHGVDLNRNFPSNDWTSGAYIPGGQFLSEGGGSNPLSEPEALALASYIGSFAPNLVLTYHATAKAVFSNNAGNSAELSAVYAEESGFGNFDSSHEDGIFNYPTTGELETWLADKKDLPTLLIELATLSSNEITTQKSAMWSMVSK